MAAAGLLLGGLVSERRLARSVAHRLKFYIDVQRKEDSFCPSGFRGDEADLLSLPPAYLIKHKEKEHSFAEIKLEASLRAYVGSAEECNRKVQKGLAKQKDLEKLIKKMAQDYVPDRMHEIKVKNMTSRQNKLPRSLSKIHLTAVPRMSPEEVKRLVSSASKLIVAATTEISPEELRTTREVKRTETKRIWSFGNGCKVFSSKLYHENEASRCNQNQTRQNEKEIKRTNEAPNGSRTPLVKPKRIFSAAAWNIQQSNLAPSLRNTENYSRCSDRPLKMKRRESSSSRPPPRPIQMFGSKSQEDSFQRSIALKTRKQPEFTGNSPNPFAKSTCEVDNSHHSMARRKVRIKFSSELASRSSILKRAGDTKQGQQDHRGKLVKFTQSNLSQKGEREGRDSPSETTSKCYQTSPADWSTLGLDRGNRRGSADATDSYAEKCIEEGQSNDCLLALKQGSSFLEELCQEMTQEGPADLTRGLFVTADGSGENPSARSLFKQESSLNEPRDTNTEEDLANSLCGQKSKLEEAFAQQAIRIPTMAPAGCRCSELPSYCVCETKEEHGMGSPGRTSALSENLDSECSEEFALSSLPSSARSFTSVEEQMEENRTQKENINSKIETFLEKLLKIPEIGVTQQEVSHQQEKQK